MLLQEPLFLKNKDWYFDDNDNEYFVKYGFCCHKLTDKAPKEAVESYLDFREALFSYDLGYVPEFVYEEYRKHMARFERPTQQN